MGLKPEWANLPKRKCDACGERYKPLRPDQRFCKTKCRMDFHRHGGAYVKLKPFVEKMVTKRLREIERTIDARIAAAVAKALGRPNPPHV